MEHTGGGSLNQEIKTSSIVCKEAGRLNKEASWKPLSGGAQRGAEV